jgi:membrane protease YdiL (CAAX protease family)
VSAERLLDLDSLVALVAVAFLIPVVEETGLRGYWFDRLQARRSALVARESEQFDRIEGLDVRTY